MAVAKKELYRLIQQVPPNKVDYAKKLLVSVINSEPIPVSAAMRRANDKPFFISSTCDKCNAILVYEYLVNNPNCKEDERWYDEFICPVCKGSIYLDCPPEYLKDTISGAEAIPLDEVLREYDT